MLIRQMELRDVDTVVELEHDLFTSPWSKEDFYYELEKNDFATILVIEAGQEIAGYIGMWALGDQSQITTLGIKKEYRRKGYAKMLLDKCIAITRVLGYSNINLEVRVSNQKAINLYEKCGFKIACIRKGYYQDNHEDAYLMIKEMEE